MGTYASRSPLRFLAPVALVLFAIALLMILSSSNGGDSGGTPTASESAKQRDLGSTAKKSKKKSGGAAAALPTKTYTVKTGDTLGSIAEKTGIPIEKLQELNPQIDPQQLSSGQRIKLRE
jgi:LysM repeat protein